MNTYQCVNSLSMMALLYLTFVLVNVMVVVTAEADSATGENKKQEVKFFVSTFLWFSLTPVVVVQSRGA